MWRAKVQDIQACLHRLETHRMVLCIATQFVQRVEALESLEFDVLDRLENIMYEHGYDKELALLQGRATRLWQQLIAVDTDLFQRLRARLVTSRDTAQTLRGFLATYIGEAAHAGARDVVGYNCLDVFVDAMLGMHAEPEETVPLHAGMIGYQATPAHIILDVIARVSLGADDVFYDIGAGVGRVIMLVALLSAAQAKGIEFEPSYCTYAQQRAAALRLPRAHFYHIDARRADYTDGTVFFLYTPFRGAMLQEVLERLREVTHLRSITLTTYGPCTLHVAQQSWLRVADDQTQLDDRTLAVFTSC